MKELSLRGVICLDFIEDQLIEINPRITASAPIAYLRYFEKQLRANLDHGFQIDQIDLNTVMNIPAEYMEDDTLTDAIHAIWRENGVLCLPQGLNPFGTTRMIFVNDDLQRTAQNSFIKMLQL